MPVTPPIVDDLKELFPDTLEYRGYLSSTGGGAVTYADPPLPITCRIRGKTMVVTGADGQEHVSTVQATLAGAFGVTARGEFTLPARYSTNPADPTDLYARRPQAVSVARFSDESGPHHEVVYFA